LTAYGGDTTQDQNKDDLPDGIYSSDLQEGIPGYSYRMGTSMAAPQVAGLAALALAVGAPVELVRDSLAGTATDLGAKGYDDNFGFGLATARTATVSSSRTYVVAVDEEGQVSSWTLVQQDSSYILSNLAPGLSVTIFAASDEDGDGILAESSELISQYVLLQSEAASISTLEDLTLTLSDGSHPISLEARP
jgi:subtilisin family serine protease